MPLNFKQVFLPSPLKWKYWLFVAFCIRSLFFFLQVHISHIGGLWGVEMNDTYGYLIPIENLVNKGAYSPDFRMPGYGMFYLPLYILFSKTLACNLLIIIQLLFSSLSVYVFALIAQKVFRNVYFFYSAFYLYLVYYYVCCYDSLLLTESFTTSFIIFSVFYIIRYFETGKKKNIIVSGILIMCIVFMRPVFLPMLLFYPFIMFMNGTKTLKNTLYTSLLFLTPFIIADSLWIIHNYKNYGKIVPLTKTIYAPQYDSTYRKQCDAFIQSWGGGFYRDHGSLANIPDYVYTSKFNADSLKKVRRYISLADSLPYPGKQKYLDLIAEKLSTYSQSIKTEKPFLYYVKAPLANLKTINNPSTQFCFIFFIPKYGHYAAFFYGWLYLIVFFSAVIGLILLAKKIFTEPLVILITGIPLYILFIHCFILRLPENRYLIPVYPLVLLFSLYTYFIIYNMISGGKRASSPSKN